VMAIMHTPMMVITAFDSSRGGARVFRSLTEIAEDGTGPSSPPIGKAVGGVMALRPGGTAYVTINTPPSNYFAYDTLINVETGESMVLAYMTQRSRSYHLKVDPGIKSILVCHVGQSDSGSCSP